MTSDPGYVLASLGRRASAWLLDATLGVLLAGTFAKVAGGEADLSALWQLLTTKSVNGRVGRQLSSAMNPSSTSLAALRPLAGLIMIVVAIAAGCVAYRVITTAKWGAGVGKSLLGLRIVVERPEASDLELPGWARSWKRWAVPQGPGLIPLPATGLLAFLPALRDPRRRGLHDRAAGTVVIDVRAPLPSPDRQPRFVASTSDEFYVTAASGM